MDGSRHGPGRGPGELAAAGGTPALALACARCGTAHGPGAPDCRCIPTLVVDDEIYLLGDP